MSPSIGFCEQSKYVYEGGPGALLSGHNPSLSREEEKATLIHWCLTVCKTSVLWITTGDCLVFPWFGKHFDTLFKQRSPLKTE